MGCWQKNINTLRAQVAADSLDVTETVEQMVLDLVQGEGDGVAEALWLVAMVAMAAKHNNEGLIRKLAGVGPEHWGATVVSASLPPTGSEANVYRGARWADGAPIAYRPGGEILCLFYGHVPPGVQIDWGSDSTGARILAKSILMDALQDSRNSSVIEAQAKKYHEGFARKFLASIPADETWTVSRADVRHMVAALACPYSSVLDPPGTTTETTIVTVFASGTGRLHTILRVTDGPHTGSYLWTTQRIDG